jgi:hypothetical protein
MLAASKVSVGRDSQESGQQLLQQRRQFAGYCWRHEALLSCSECKKTGV